MAMVHEQRQNAQQGSWDDFLAVLSGRPLWKLLVKGLRVFLPEYQVTTSSVLVADNSSVTGFPVFLSGDTGFGLRLRQRAAHLQPAREIYIRGREVRSIGIVVNGSASAIGTRIVDPPGLIRYGRKLTFETLFDTAEARSVISAVRAAKAVENIVFLDPVAGIGLCGEVDPITRVPACPLFVRIGDRTTGAVRIYTSGGWAAQAVRSRT
ncbi:MAG TPA: hypothetical protein VH912_21900 [Streptosporangiaceae bacterium]|jgi:hypothetical protein